MYEFIDKNGNISANSAKLVVIDKYGKVKEVATGYECGLNIHNFNDIKEGDIIEGYENVEIKRKL